MYEEILYGDRLFKNVPVDNRDAMFGILGTNPDNEPAAWPISASAISKHFLFLGAIGTGKTNAINCFLDCIRNTMTNKDIMFIFDTKGDYLKQFKRRGDVVISNDGFATNGYAADYWNLFKEIMADPNREENAMEIARSVFSERIENTSQPFFPNAAKDLLTALLLHLCRTESRPDNQILLKNLQSMTSEKFVSILKSYPEFGGMVPYISDPKSGQTLGVLSELQSAMKELLVGNFAKAGSISIRDMVKNKGGRVVFVEYDLGIGGVLSPIYRLMFDFALKEALRRRVNEGRVFFAMDEFSLLPKLNHIDDGVNFGRSLGVSVIAGAQNISQIRNAYGEDRADSLLSGFSTTVCFRLNDGTSCEFFKELNGKNGRVTSFDSGVRAKGMINQFREAFIVEDHDIHRLRTGEAIIKTGNYPPFKFRFKEYGK